MGWYTHVSELEPVIDAVRPLAGKQVLDAGCGTGRYFDGLTGREVTGIDYSFSMLEAAHERRTGARLLQGSVTELPVASESFDLVYSVRVIQHIRDQEAMVREMARVARPGGHVILVAYNSWSLLNLYKQIRMSWLGRILNLPFRLLLGRRSFFNPWGFTYDNYCSIPEIRGMMRRAGLEPVESAGVTSGMPWFWNDFFIGKVLQKTMPWLLRFIFRFFLFIDRTIARRFPLKFFMDKVLVVARKP